MLFGLGLGFFLTGLVWVLLPGPHLAEEEIIAEARKLGMVFREEVVFLPDGDSSTNSRNEVGEQQKVSAQEKTEEKTAGKTNVSNEETTVVIPAGSTLLETAQILSDAGIVDYEEFLAEAKAQDIARRIIAGEYRIPAGIGTAEVIDMITR